MTPRTDIIFKTNTEIQACQQQSSLNKKIKFKKSG